MVSIIFSGKKTESFSSKSSNRARIPPLTTTIQHSTIVLARIISKEKEIKCVKVKYEVRLSLLADDIILYVYKPLKILQKNVSNYKQIQ